MHGPEGVRFYTRLKTFTTRWPTGMRAEAELVMPWADRPRPGLHAGSSRFTPARS
jgi:hypothetical protein